MKELLAGCVGLLGLAACKKEETAPPEGVGRKVAERSAASPGVEVGKATPEGERRQAVPRPKQEKKSEYPVGKVVQGQPGFVTSPFNKQIVDVRGVPPGTLVQDPSFPAAERRLFRVPDPSPNPNPTVSK
ncbi:hypothetical protein llg_29830 [Luteolibacter sp. LG18]|nr:hypothetical protein llg_29830 [Luteolibacter sp. LG18]